MAMAEKLGVIGGVGSAATALFFTRVVEYTRATCDQEHLDVSIFNRPGIPDRTAYLLGLPGAPSFVGAMRDAALELESCGCKVLATPCNTAHAKLDEIAEGLQDAEFVNMLSETASFVAELGVTRCAVLATDGTLATQVYDRALGAVGIEAVAPDAADQQIVMSVIYDQVKAGIAPDAEALRGVCERMIECGCDGVILGCTELSLVPLPYYLGDAPVVDALNVLAWSCVQACGAPAFDFPALYR